MIRYQSFRCAMLMLVALAAASPVGAEAPLPLELGLRDLNAHCPFDPPASLEDWNVRTQQLRHQMEVSLGLFPQPVLDPVKPSIYGKVQREGYSIEKVTFESLPGFFVTGNLYRPAQIPEGKKVPAILCPHGHWTNARFYDEKPEEVKHLLAIGAERFETAARNHIQARCVQLARMGCIVFHWDMIGYCDSSQISLDRAHRFAKQPKESEVTDKGWLLFSPLAESHCQSVLGLQILASQRAVDMLLSLPEVDPQRIAITGASGGGTQSFLSAALDKRISVAFPAVMVSTGMQGGCTCENACMLRIGTGNVEMAGLIAPRPLGLTAADDWTKTMPQDGFPELQKLYKLLGAGDKVALFPNVHFDHNFNHVSRTSMYGWMNKHLNLGFEMPVLEQDFQIALRPELTVWDAEHPQPRGGEDFERELMKLWATIVDNQLQGLRQGDQTQVAQLVDILRTGWQVNLGLTTLHYGQELAQHQVEELPIVQANQAGLSIEVVDPKNAEAAKTVIYPALTGQNGGQADKGQPQALVDNPRLAAAYTYGYNLPQFAQRAQQLGLTLAKLSRENAGKVLVVGGQGPDAALAAAGVFCAQQLAGQPKDAVVLELNIQPQEFSFAMVDGIRDPNFVPGSARFLDLAGLLAALDGTKIRLKTANGSRYQNLQRVHQASGNTLEISAP